MPDTPPVHRYDTRAPERRAELVELRADVRALGDDVRSELGRWRAEQRDSARRDAADRAAHLAELRRSTDAVRRGAHETRRATHGYLGDVRTELRESAETGRRDRAAHLAELRRYAAELGATLNAARGEWRLQREDRLRAGRERREELLRAFDPAPRVAWLERYRQEMAAARAERLEALERLRRELGPILRPWTAAPETVADSTPDESTADEAPAEPFAAPARAARPKRRPVRSVDPLTALIGLVGRTPGITRADLLAETGIEAADFDGMMAELIRGDVLRLRDGHYYLAVNAPDETDEADDPGEPDGDPVVGAAAD